MGKQNTKASGKSETEKRVDDYLKRKYPVNKAKQTIIPREKSKLA